MTFTVRVLELLKAYRYLLLIGSLGSAHAQQLQPRLTQLPNAPAHKIFWVEVGAYIAFNVLDGYTTIRNTHQGVPEGNFPTGSPFLIGRYPGAVRYVAVMGGIEVGSTLLAYRLERSRNRFWRSVGHAIMLQGTYAHADGAIRNFRLRLPSRPSPDPGKKFHPCPSIVKWHSFLQSGEHMVHDSES